MALSNLTISCSAEKNAGLKYLYLIEQANLTSMTLASGSSSNYDTITLASGAAFKTIGFEQDQAEYRENTEVERRSPKTTHEIEFYVPGVNANNRDALEALKNEVPCGYIAVIEDNNSQKWVIGYSEEFGKERPMRLLTDETTTAKALGETNGSTVTLQSVDTVKAYTVSATIVTS